MTKSLNRRSFMMRVSGAALLGGSVATVTGCVTAGTYYTGVSDSDPTDPVGHGRTGVTDADPVDLAGRGRRGARLGGGVTDADTGANADPPGRGHGSASARGYQGPTAGSGFFISRDGYIVTNYHVVRDRTEITVEHNSLGYAATLVAHDERNDIALLKIDAEGYALPLGSATGLRVGEDVMALGYPLTSIQGGEMRASFGRINAMSGINADARYVQIDVPVQPGNSGGPLIGPDGRVVAIVTARLDDMATLRATGALPQNISFGMRIDYLTTLLPADAIVNRTPLAGSTADRVQTARAGIVMVRTAAVTGAPAASTSSAKPAETSPAEAAPATPETAPPVAVDPPPPPSPPAPAPETPG